MTRILVVFNTFYSELMGPRRVRRIVRRLPDNGFSPVVLTDTAAGLAADYEIPVADIVRIPSPDLARIYARLRRREPACRPGALPADASGSPVSRDVRATALINRWLMIPDKHILWRRPAVAAARNVFRHQPFELVFASHQPATNLLVAARISREFHVPLVIEYRDLWTANPYYSLQQATGLHRAIHARLEKSVLRRADRVSCVCEGIADCLSRKYSGVLRSPPTLNYNFFDPDEFENLPASGARHPGQFIISYVGSMYFSRRPDTFLRGLRQFIDSCGLTPDRLRFRWLGAIVGIPDIEKITRELGIAPFVDYVGQVEHKRALQELVRSDIALLIQSPEDDVHVPGKLFEAMGARVPVLAVSNPCELTRLVESARAGISCNPEPGAVSAALAQVWQQRQAGARWTFDESRVMEFEASNAVRKLCDLFREATGAPRA